jgi:formate hydrogenlyase subunit 6/NADH:ubiquinone oxidoreductase subunit I
MGCFKLAHMTLHSLFSHPDTVCYPAQTKPVPSGLKGHIVNDVSTCIMCGICAKTCPSGALTVDRKAGTWTINRFRCVQCGSCIRACPKGSLSMDPTYQKPSRHMYDDVVTKSIPDPKDAKA